MLILFYKRYPFGTKEAFAEDELAALAKTFDRIKIYCFAEKTDIKRDIPENCELVDLYDKKRVWSRRLLAALKMFLPGTVKEIFYMRRCGYKICPKNLRRIFMYYFYDGFAAKKMFNLSPGDVLYSYWLGDVSYPVSKLKRKNPGVRFVSRAHGFDMYADRGYNPFRREIIGQLDRLFCINSSGRDDILAHYGEFISSDKVVVSHLGVKCPEKAPERSFGGDGTVIVTVSNIIPLKRLDMLIGALSLIDHPVTWYHFGSGQLEKDVHALAKEKLSGKANVRYEFKGQTDHNEVLRFLREEKIDLFVNCSDYEGIPVSIMEAMAYGIPCIARNVGGISELVDRDNGYLLENITDEKKLSEVIIDYIKLPLSEKEAKSKKAFDKISSDFDSVKNYDSLVDQIDLISK